MFYGREFIMHNKILIGTWTVACSSMSIFTLLPAIKTENINMMYVSIPATLIGVINAVIHVLIILLTA